MQGYKPPPQSKQTAAGEAMYLFYSNYTLFGFLLSEFESSDLYMDVVTDFKSTYLIFSLKFLPIVYRNTIA